MPLQSDMEPDTSLRKTRFAGGMRNRRSAGGVLNLIMLERCFFCRRDLPANPVLEHFPHGQRVAYDPWRGRLWAVCGGCRRWMLAPFDGRLEALDELEGVVRDRGRVLARTENVALVRVGPIDVVRVGDVQLREEAWWRYGESLAVRARKAKSIARFGKVFDGALMMLMVGVPYWGWSDPEKWIERARNHSFGKHAWRARVPCTRCGSPLRSIAFRERHLVRVLPAVTGDPAIWRACSACGLREDAGHRLEGAAGAHLLRRLLAYQNYAGASLEQIGRATDLVAGYPSADAFVRAIAAQRPTVGRLPPTYALALEIASHDARERRLLAAEAGTIEERWREEERIAAIADGELS